MDAYHMDEDVVHIASFKGWEHAPVRPVAPERPVPPVSPAHPISCQLRYHSSLPGSDVSWRFHDGARYVCAHRISFL